MVPATASQRGRPTDRRQPTEPKPRIDPCDPCQKTGPLDADPSPWRFVWPIREQSLHSGPFSKNLSFFVPTLSWHCLLIHSFSCAFDPFLLHVLCLYLSVVFTFQHLRIDSPSHTSPKVLLVQSFHTPDLRLSSVQISSQTTAAQNTRFLRCFPSLRSSGRSFEGRLSCILFKVDIWTSVEPQRIYYIVIYRGKFWTYF